MPAEWEPHDATWLSWPKDPNTFPPDILPEVEKAFSRMASALSGGEEVRILVDDEKAESRAKDVLGKVGNVTFHTIHTVDVWVRDYAPICIRGEDVALTKWVFNAWGNKYDDLKPDNESGLALAKSTGLRMFEPGIVLEGGSVDVNGRGALLTTEQCLLNPNRNPSLTKPDIELKLRESLGATHVIWLGSGIEGDDTDGHVDDIVRFVNPDSVVMAWESDESDPNHAVMVENLRRLRDAEDQEGEILDIVTIPMPAPIYSGGVRLPASHLNFYIGNSAVLVPTFGSPTDSDALGTLRGYFPGRDVVGIDCRALVYGLGTIHCATQQVPSKAPR